jgi:hypothetical protein
VKEGLFGFKAIQVVMNKLQVHFFFIFLQDSAADTNPETEGCMYGEGLLMISA